MEGEGVVQGEGEGDPLEQAEFDSEEVMQWEGDLDRVKDLVSLRVLELEPVVEGVVQGEGVVEGVRLTVPVPQGVGEWEMDRLPEAQ